MRDESDVHLSQLIPEKTRRKIRWKYEYDFGDGWGHEILFEKSPPAVPKAKYPQCLDGARACPPEDCGGPWGYADLVPAFVDPKDERYEEMKEWLGKFNPEAFDAIKATKAMRNAAKYHESE